MQSAQGFHMKSRLRFKFPTPWKTLIIKFPPPRDGKSVKCLGYARGGCDVEAPIWPIHKYEENNTACRLWVSLLTQARLSSCSETENYLWMNYLIKINRQHISNIDRSIGFSMIDLDRFVTLWSTSFLSLFGETEWCIYSQVTNNIQFSAD